MSSKLWLGVGCWVLGLGISAGRPALAGSKKTPPPPAAQPAAPAAPTTLTAGDRLSVKVLGETEISKEYSIDESGQIQMEIVGTVKAAGLTTEQFQGELEKQLGKYIRKPSVTVVAFKKVGVG